MKFPFVALVAAALFFLEKPAHAQLTPQQQKDLTAFTHLYGYVRYFHPSDEAAELDWDKFAIYGAQKVMEAKDDQELIQQLKELFHPFAPTVTIFPEAQHDSFSIASITPPNKNNYMPIAWQHFGVGLSPKSVYKSIRVNRPTQDKPVSEEFAPIAQSFPADRLKGKEFRFSGWMKVDSSSGGAGFFWMRVQKKGQIVYFYNMNNRPVTSNTWKEYSFTGEANKDADTVVLGAFLTGKGSLLMDHIQLCVKEEGAWKNIPLGNSGFEEKGSNPWHYNPTLAGYRFATVTTDAQEGNKAMSIVSVKAPVHRSSTPAKPLFDQYPKPGEYIQHTLVPNVACIVPIALYGTKEQTFPAADSATLSSLDDAIRVAAPASANGDSLAVRLGDVIISWNIFRHFFPYWEEASSTPDQLLEKALTKAATDKSRYDFLQTLQLMTAPLNDGHIYIYLQGDTVRRAYVPLIFAEAEGQLVVDRVLDSTQGVLPGDIVVSVNGQPADQYMANLDRLASGSQQLKVFRDLVSLAFGPRDSSLVLGIKRQDRLHTIAVQRNMESQNWYRSRLQHPSGWIKPHVFYIDLDRDPLDSIRAWMPQLEQARAIVCDLRGYPNSNHELISHLLTETENTKWMFVPQITHPDYEQVAYSEMGWNMHPINPHLNGKIFFLTDGSAISYAESYMGFIKDFHLATIVGQPTAGTNGNINPFTLPGGYHFSWTGMLVKDHQGGKHHLKGIVPDVPVDRTIEGIREGRDEMLDKALQLAVK